MPYYVYLHTTPSGKRYVGVTTQNPSARWRNGKGYIRNIHFWQAIQEYGWDSIKHEVWEVDNECEMLLLEEVLIEYLDSKNNGYNIQEGGLSSSCTEVTRQRLSVALKGKYCGEKASWYGKHHTEESKQKISESHKGIHHTEETKQKLREYCGEKASWYGRHHTEESKQKISESHKGGHHTEETKRKLSEQKKGLYKGENNPNFGKRHTEETKRKLSEQKKGLYKGENNPNFGKRHSEEAKQRMRERHSNAGAEAKRRSVLQYTKEGVFLKEWSSINEASIQTQTNRTSISEVCRGERLTAGGYVWKYKEDKKK